MNTTNILNTMRKYPQFLGVFPSDEHCLPKKIFQFPSALIVNTDPHSLPGQHWIAIYFANRENVEYFDSSGNLPKIRSIVEFMNKNANILYYNSIKLQSDFSVTCGGYCIYFLTSRLSGRTMKSILMDFNKNTYLNDYIIYSMYFE